MAENALPKPASTIILVRPDEGGKFAIFMTRRPAEMKFMGGSYVFPGGSVDEQDCSKEMLSRCRGLEPAEARRILGDASSPELSLGHWVAGIRELFEEVGILLSVTETGAGLNMKEELRKRLAEKREALVAGDIEFRILLESEGLYCDASRPVYFGHRITPEKYPVRFDTRFYLARLPAGQYPLSSSQEVSESLWITPGQALDQAEKGSLQLMPPTLATLRTLAACDSWRSLCARYPLG